MVFLGTGIRSNVWIRKRYLATRLVTILYLSNIGTRKNMVDLEKDSLTLVSEKRLRDLLEIEKEVNLLREAVEAARKLVESDLKNWKTDLRELENSLKTLDEARQK